MTHKGKATDNKTWSVNRISKEKPFFKKNPPLYEVKASGLQFSFDIF